MKRTALHGLGLGLEDEEAVVEEVAAPEASETADETPADEVIEVTEASDKVEDATEVVEELQEQEAALESLKIALESCVADGGLDAKSAVFFNHAYRQITDRIGLKPGTVSVESFGGGTSRLNATNISLESIGETLKKIWLAIKNAVMRAAKAIADFFAKIFGGVDKIKKQAEAIKKQAADITEDATKDVTVRSAGKLQVGAKFEAAGVQTGLDNLKKVLDGLMTTHVETAKKSMDIAATFFGVAIKDEAAAEEASKAVEAGEEAVGAEVKKTEEDLTKAVISGNFRVVLKDTKSPQLGMKIISSGETGTAESQTIKALGKQAINGICDSVIEICTVMEKKKAKIDELKAHREATQKKIDSGIAAMSKADKPGIGAKLKTNVALRLYRNDQSAVIAQATSHAFSACRSALVLAEKSVAVQKGKTEKKDDKAA